jgi:hypothetical protein
MAHPFQAHVLERISNIVSCCMMMHNMCISDCMMDCDVYARYNPAYNITDMELEENIEFPDDFEAVAGLHERNTAVIGLSNGNEEVVVRNMLDRLSNWRELNDAEGHSCLHVASMKCHW